jgi:putative PIN family toxin of toxin-antitoxin system
VISAVVDANVLASGFIQTDSPAGRVVTLWLDRRYSLVMSAYVLDELTRTFAKPYFRSRMTDQRIAVILRAIRRGAMWTELHIPVCGVAAHSSDDPVLATAVSAGAPFLVTGDRELRRLGRYGGVTILTPQVFLPVVEADLAKGDSE